MKKTGLEIVEILYKTIMNDGEYYEGRYTFIGELNDLTKYGFKKLKENDLVEELKIKISSENIAYYKKSGLGFFLISKEDDNKLLFFSSVPMWWIDDEYETNYYEDLDVLIKNGLIKRIKED